VTYKNVNPTQVPDQGRGQSFHPGWAESEATEYVTYTGIQDQGSGSTKQLRSTSLYGILGVYGCLLTPSGERAPFFIAGQTTNGGKLFVVVDKTLYGVDNREWGVEELSVFVKAVADQTGLQS
jgi:hypothetical protein